MRLYLSGRILSVPSLHIHSGGTHLCSDKMQHLIDRDLPRGPGEKTMRCGGGDRDRLGHFAAPVSLCTRQQGFSLSFFFP